MTKEDKKIIEALKNISEKELIEIVKNVCKK